MNLYTWGSRMNTRGLSKAKLQYLAICAMVADHTAWAFLDFNDPIAFVIHIFGRLTIPIMCFFIAEGFAKTSDIKKYILRMSIFAVISIVPFYMFFHEEYGYRQNIIFDELLALLSLCAMKCGSIKKPVRIILVILLFIVSFAIGGWPGMPIIYALVFTYNEKFKDKTKWFCFFTLLLSAVVAAIIFISRLVSPDGARWSYGQSVYLLGFMLALIPLSKYNGEKGVTHTGRYFFYIFYPAHLLLLWGLKQLIQP